MALLIVLDLVFAATLYCGCAVSCIDMVQGIVTKIAGARHVHVTVCN